MNTDTIRQKFEEWASRNGMDTSKLSWGKYCMNDTIIAEDAFEAGFEQGQRDLIEAMGEPVAWQSDVKSPFAAVLTASHFNADLDALYRHGRSTGMIPLYRLPEDAPK